MDSDFEKQAEILSQAPIYTPQKKSPRSLQRDLEQDSQQDSHLRKSCSNLTKRLPLLASSPTPPPQLEDQLLSRPPHRSSRSKASPSLTPN